MQKTDRDIREQLFAAAIDVVNAHGWRGATTRRIADAAGVNEVTIFRQFGSKETLIREAMLWNAERTPVTALPAEPVDPVAELRIWADAHHARLLATRSHIRQTIGHMEAHPDVASIPRMLHTQLSVALRRYLDRSRQLGLTRGDWEPIVAANLLLGTLFADAIGRDVMSEQPEPVAEAPRRYVDLFLRAIGCEPGPAVEES